MVICNLHSLEIAKEYCDRLIGLSDGKIVFDGHPSSLTKELAEQLYDLENDPQELNNLASNTKYKIIGFIVSQLCQGAKYEK